MPSWRRQQPSSTAQQSGMPSWRRQQPSSTTQRFRSRAARRRDCCYPLDEVGESIHDEVSNQQVAPKDDSSQGGDLFPNWDRIMLPNGDRTISKHALIFDFMPNGSLDKHIFNREKTSPMDWEMKFKIAVGVARGIKYLHHGCDFRILHFDIKPHNILLDDNFVPKISDFGLAKLCATNKEAVTLTAARGTIWYVAPELINRSIGRVSYKADVYSFRMLLMEMVSLNKHLTRNNDESSKYFPNWIYDHLSQGRGH
ncbi:hypothetical protein SASPL_143807 [Salvia splendens]|uniref:Protein kinase domain-containing protein n=1 Tax=Salvia splendens TaxID=180675 RepID=A0A8X8ZAP2_SALSN|nr:hypothetical protein SASPL_143807 [Salvia splendens]